MSSLTPRQAPSEVRAETGTVAQPVFAQPVRRRGGLVVGAVIGFTVVGIALLLVLGYFLLAIGAALTIVGGILALIPLTIVLLGIRWLDRWEPEPRLVLLFASLWGGTVSVLLALFVDSGVQGAIAATGGPTDDTVFLQTVVQAPIVEEFGKGIAVLLIFLIGRNYFDGPIDGIVYAASVGAGFAFTENIQYFALELASEGGFGQSVAMVFFIRGLLSPFAHVMFTAMTGLAIGIAARNGHRGLAVLAFVIGLIPAVLLHMLWNGALYFVSDFFGYYFVVQVPLFIGMVVLVVLLQRRDVKLTQARLTEYAAAGWFNPAEVASLGTAAGRRAAMSWAKRYGMARPMREYIRDSTRLAFARQRLLSGRDIEGGQADERELLVKVSESRRRLTAQPMAAQATAPPPPPPSGPPIATV
jgi:RsiW-degrading membrane proteinase PrsW (M82 family)